MSDFEDYGTKLSFTPPDCAELFWAVVFFIDKIRLIEDLSSFFEANTMLELDGAALDAIKIEAHGCINVISLSFGPFRRTSRVSRQW